LPTLNSRRTMEHSAMPVVAHSTKWTVVVDSQQVASTLMLCGSKAEADAAFVRLRESGVAHVYVLPPISAGTAHPVRGEHYVL
jgi:hypothetical protein